MRLINYSIFLCVCVLSETFVYSSLWPLEKKENEKEVDSIPKKNKTTDQKEDSTKKDAVKEMQCPKPSCKEVIPLKQFITSILSKIQGIKRPSPDGTDVDDSREKINYVMGVDLSYQDQSTLSNYLNTKANIHDVTEVLSQMVTSISRHKECGELFDFPYFNYNLDPFLIVFVIILVLALLLVIFYPKYYIISRLFLFLFISSIIWNWFLLYEEEVSKIRATFDKGPPKGCVPDNKQGFFSYYFKDMFTAEKDPCIEYMKIVSISPFFKVSPMDAFSICVVNIILTPLEKIGTHMNLFILSLIGPLPFYLKIIVLALVFISFLFIMLTTSGYSISTPLLWVSKPNTDQNKQVLEKELKDVLKNINQKLSCLETNMKNIEGDLQDNKDFQNDIRDTLSLVPAGEKIAQQETGEHDSQLQTIPSED